ncbi:MAG TPA: GxGYxYP domain-containing protein [Ktedonobacteraceae bacterium]|nr:GxGYxYP domain-containing protein [Ktedonobacteraceae bacterium]
MAELDWPADRLLPQFQTPQHLTVYDIRKASSAVQLSVSTLAGLINRPRPQVYLLASDEDAFWLQQLAAAIPHETSPASNDDALAAMLAAFPNYAKGLIIHNTAFPDSINIATMMAGQQDGVVVSQDQVAALQASYQLPILADLRTQQWQQRASAYDWARQNLLQGASTRIIAGLDPKICAGVRAFLVATRAFIYWLDSRDFLPDPRDRWQSERGLMQQILSSFAGQAVHLGWFIDEASGVSLTSLAAIPVLATDFMTNLETWTAIAPAAPPARGASLPPSPVGADLSRPPIPGKVYLSFTVSDGDNLQYIQHRMLRLWRDPARGSFPLGWTFSPIMAQAAPAMSAWYLDTATPNDELMAGPSGAGYMFPSYWPADQLPAFLQRTGQSMQKSGMTQIEMLDAGFLQSLGIPFLGDLLHPGMKLSDHAMQKNIANTLAAFSITGIFSGSGVIFRPSWHVIDGTPVYENLGLAGSVSQTVSMVKLATATFLKRPLFLNIYILAWSMTPSTIKQAIEQLGSDYEVVTPGTLLAMLAKVQA